MGRLTKYARKPTGTRSKPLTTKLSDEEYQDFLRYIKSLGLTSSEAIRFLILEELCNAEQPHDNQMFTNVGPRYDKSTPSDASEKPQTLHKKTKVNPRKAAVYLKQFKVNGKLPCPVCRTWTSAAHFKQRHAGKHAGMSSAEFLAKYEKEALQMVQKIKKKKIDLFRSNASRL